MIKQILTGTGVAIITPFKKNKDIDFEALEKVINYTIENGVNHIVTMGTTGETPTLSKEEKQEIVNFTIEKTNDRVPIVVGIGGNNTKETISHFNDFPFEKITAILSASPYYNKPSQEGIFAHYQLLAKEAPKPIILYGFGRNNIATYTAIA